MFDVVFLFCFRAGVFVCLFVCWLVGCSFLVLSRFCLLLFVVFFLFFFFVLFCFFLGGGEGVGWGFFCVYFFFCLFFFVVVFCYLSLCDLKKFWIIQTYVSIWLKYWLTLPQLFGEKECINLTGHVKQQTKLIILLHVLLKLPGG